MRVLVTGATGVLGSALMTAFASAGHEPIAMSRKPGPGRRVADVATGQGLTAAVEGVDAIVHAASDPRGNPEPTDIVGTRRLAGFGLPLLYVSIVGVDRHPYKYYCVKREGEQVLESAKCPWTILRATQFHDFLAMMFAMSRSLGVKVPGLTELTAPFIYPKDWMLQPVSRHDVANQIIELVTAGPTNSIEQFAGPEVIDMQTLATSWAAANGGRAVGMPFVGKSAKAFKDGLALPTGRIPYGTVTWEDFLAGRDIG